MVLAGLPVFTAKPLNMAQFPQRISFTEPVTEILGQRQGLNVILASLPVLTYKPLNLAQPP